MLANFRVKVANALLYLKKNTVALEDRDEQVHKQ